MLAANNTSFPITSSSWGPNKAPYYYKPQKQFNAKSKPNLSSSPMTTTLALTCIATFIKTNYTKSRWLEKGCLNLSKVYKGQTWRLATFPFLHANLLHIASNMTFLLCQGPVFEKKWGASGFAKVGVLATVANILAQATLGSDRESLVGLSGVLYGIQGALAAKEAKEGNTYSVVKQAILNLSFEMAICIGLKELKVANISYLAHTSGFIAGFAYGWFAKPKK